MFTPAQNAKFYLIIFNFDKVINVNRDHIVIFYMSPENTISLRQYDLSAQN